MVAEKLLYVSTFDTGVRPYFDLLAILLELLLDPLSYIRIIDSGDAAEADKKFMSSS